MTPGEWDTRPKITAQQWDTHWWRIYQDLINDGEPETFAGMQAARECADQFGDRPEDEETDR